MDRLENLAKKMSYIRLPDGLKKKTDKTQLSLPKNEKIKDLLGSLLYIANLQDPTLQNKVENILKNTEDLQKYLLATDDLKDTMEESLDLAVGYGRLNDGTEVRHVSERDDPDYNFFKKNDNQLDVVYKKQAKFDIQNPVIGSLLKQINKPKISNDGTKAALDKVPNPKYLELEERYRKIFKDGDDKKPPPNSPNYIDRFFGPSPPPEPPRTPPPSPPPPPPPFNPGGQGPFDNFLRHHPCLLMMTIDQRGKNIFRLLPGCLDQKNMMTLMTVGMMVLNMTIMIITFSDQFLHSRKKKRWMKTFRVYFQRLIGSLKLVLMRQGKMLSLKILAQPWKGEKYPESCDFLRGMKMIISDKG